MTTKPSGSSSLRSKYISPNRQESTDNPLHTAQPASNGYAKQFIAKNQKTPKKIQPKHVSQPLSTPESAKKPIRRAKVASTKIPQEPAPISPNKQDNTITSPGSPSEANFSESRKENQLSESNKSVQSHQNVEQVDILETIDHFDPNFVESIDRIIEKEKNLIKDLERKQEQREQRLRDLTADIFKDSPETRPEVRENRTEQALSMKPEISNDTTQQLPEDNTPVDDISPMNSSQGQNLQIASEQPEASSDKEEVTEARIVIPSPSNKRRKGRKERTPAISREEKARLKREEEDRIRKEVEEEMRLAEEKNLTVEKETKEELAPQTKSEILPVSEDKPCVKEDQTSQEQSPPTGQEFPTIDDYLTNLINFTQFSLSQPSVQPVSPHEEEREPENEPDAWQAQIDSASHPVLPVAAPVLHKQQTIPSDQPEPGEEVRIGETSEAFVKEMSDFTFNMLTTLEKEEEVKMGDEEDIFGDDDADLKPILTIVSALQETCSQFSSLLATLAEQLSSLRKPRPVALPPAADIRTPSPVAEPTPAQKQTKTKKMKKRKVKSTLESLKQAKTLNFSASVTALEDAPSPRGP
ncbi:hypothetical protein BLNAU_16618 [Blattamonas nauphoetae]|uniref:Uncharacterized protein n=1 Tax=Blattamonas nauphoetae TaxID=2049346 RepID=A0ABQ9XB11_9EUKA|nr:hypothetical protein BLNAU_16618 [Blattamonas nauphoetae]